ncbi:phage portal protein [Pantoea sp. 18069]|uniref:phage portal protein n=1 Tax=Pantoea sp. 18069 TaxID=2681415 RepID=UPI0013571DEC|nr:phage portal protein [Pantoea sp. 18069]
MTQTFNMTAQAHGSRVLGGWIAGREGAAERAGLLALGESEVTSGGTTMAELAGLLGASSRSAAGVRVTKDAAMRVSVVYAAVSLVAGAIASLPISIYERASREKVDHEYWYLLNESAGGVWTAFTFWEYLMSSKLFEGDGFAELVRSSVRSSKILALKPLHPLSVDPFKKGDKVLYRVNPADGGPSYTLDSADMLHIPSLGFDGLRSPSPITFAGREAIGAAIAAQDHSSRFFASGANIDYALKAPGRLSGKQLDDLKASLMARAMNGGRGPLILSGGLEPAQLSINSKDAEILATRLFGVEEISRILGVPPHMIGHTDKQTSFGTGIEQQGIGFVRYTLQRHLTPIRQELNRKFWPTREQLFLEHMVEALERADLKTRYEAYRIAMGRAGEMPWMDANEVRRRENLPSNASLLRNPGKDDGKEKDEKPTQ